MSMTMNLHRVKTVGVRRVLFNDFEALIFTFTDGDNETYEITALSKERVELAQPTTHFANSYNREQVAA
jgi:hypothetical protein